MITECIYEYFEFRFRNVQYYTVLKFARYFFNI